MPTVDDCKLIDIHTIVDRGKLSVVEFNSLPFKPQRIFYIYDVDTIETRGNHAHYKTEQFLICISGECGVGVYDGERSEEIHLNNPSKGLYIPAMIWDTQLYSRDAVLVVLANTSYDKRDYITDYEEFKRLKNGQF